MSEFTAKKLREARNAVGLSQDEAANRMKISRKAYNLNFFIIFSFFK